MRNVILTLIWVLVACGSSQSATSKDIRPEPYLGLSAFAAMHPKFPCDQLIISTSGIPNNPAVSVLWGTFGEDTTCLANWIKSQSYRPHLVQIHFSNEVCRRKKNCREGEFFGSLTTKEYNAFVVKGDQSFKDAVRSRVESIKALFALGNDNTTWVLGMGLEDSYSHLTALKLYDELSLSWDKKVSRNPLYETDWDISKATLELHGEYPNLTTNCIANLDGVSIDIDTNYKPSISGDAYLTFTQNYCQTCNVVFGWSAPAQGIHSESFVPPRERTFHWPEGLHDLASQLSC